MAETNSMTLEQVVSEVTADEHADVLREAVRLVCQELMNAEVSELIGAALGERSPARATWRNGYRAVTDPEEKRAALAAFAERVAPGRWADARPPTLGAQGHVDPRAAARRGLREGAYGATRGRRNRPRAGRVGRRRADSARARRAGARPRPPGGDRGARPPSRGASRLTPAPSVPRRRPAPARREDLLVGQGDSGHQGGSATRRPVWLAVAGRPCRRGYR
jgi:hypothetical protein